MWFLDFIIVCTKNSVLSRTASVCHLLFANKRILAACWNIVVERACRGAFLTAWGKTDDVLTVPISG
jgi:hypothetical protein